MSGITACEMCETHDLDQLFCYSNWSSLMDGGFEKSVSCLLRFLESLLHVEIFFLYPCV